MRNKKPKCKKRLDRSMNIFILDENTELCAQYHCDKHVVKMILESAQLLCTAVQENTRIEGLYKPTHRNHPCGIWTRTSRSNFLWLADLARQLCTEYTYRYSKQHNSLKTINRCVDLQELIQPGPLTPFAKAMPDEYRNDGIVESYRKYYIGAKSDILCYSRRDIPIWVRMAGLGVHKVKEQPYG